MAEPQKILFLDDRWIERMDNLTGTREHALAAEAPNAMYRVWRPLTTARCSWWTHRPGASFAAWPSVMYSGLFAEASAKVNTCIGISGLAAIR